MCAGPGTAIYVDAGAYPISRWGVERAALRGVPIRAFPHLDADVLRSRIDDDWSAGLRPLVVSDGVCGVRPRHSRPGLPRRGTARRWPPRPGRHPSAGHSRTGCGAGRPVRSGRRRIAAPQQHRVPDVVLVASMAKGLGVPMTVIAGDRNLIRELNERGRDQVALQPALDR